MNTNTSTGNLTAGTGGSSEAFEAFENGASIEEINEKYFSNNDQSEALNESEISAGDKTLKSVPEDTDNTDSVRQAEPAQNERGTGVSDAGDTDVAAKESFSQSEIDSIVGRRIEKERRLRDALQNDFDSFKARISNMLGVDSGDIDSAIENEMIKREMSGKVVDDPDLYIRARRAEIERDALKTKLDSHRADDERNAFASVITSQLREFENSHPESDIIKMTSDNNFNLLLKTLYDNSDTRDKCVEMAARAFGFGSPDVINSSNSVSKLSDADVSHTESPSASQALKDANKGRSSEAAGAPRSPMSSDKKFDYEKMSVSDFDEIQRRVARGEKIMP